MIFENYSLVNLRQISAKHVVLLDHLSEIRNYPSAHNKTQVSMNFLLGTKVVKFRHSSNFVRTDVI